MGSTKGVLAQPATHSMCRIECQLLQGGKGDIAAPVLQ